MMLAEASLKVSVSRGAKTLVEVDVDSNSILIGSGSHCDVRLGPEDMAVEQLFLELRPAGLFGDARAATPLVVVDGVPFAGGRISDGSTVRVGDLNLRVEVMDHRPKRQSSLAQRVNPRLLLGLVAIAALGALIVQRRLARSGEQVMLEPPSVFSGPPAGCPESSAEAAAAAAEELLNRADGRRERSPFVPEDAVEAVKLYRRVSACLTVAEWAEGAKIVTADADRLQAQTENAMHLHNVRLSRALELKRGGDAQREIRILRAYVLGQPGQYADWLSKLERDLDLEQGKSAPKRKT